MSVHNRFEEAMNVPSRVGLLGFISRLGRPPSVDSDADLLDQFIRSADGAAFTNIVQRHGMMVLSVCRRRLDQEADVEDAFQAVFLALAKSARSIGQRESLPGWLYRVAYLISLKAAGIRARQPLVAWPSAEVAMPNQSTPHWETSELKAAIDDEMARLPDKFRSVVALCLIEGRTNVEAATILGVPVGTIDSRLHTARKRLSARLLSRGVATVSGVTLAQMLGGPVTAANYPRILELTTHTIQLVLTETVGLGTGAVSPTVANLAKGVTMLTTTRLRLFAALGIAIGILGGTATGIYLANAADPPQATNDQPTKPLNDPVSVASIEKTSTTAANKEALADGGMLSKSLKKLTLGDGGVIVLNDLFDTLEDETELIVRVDIGAFRRLGIVGFNEDNSPFSPNMFMKTIYDTKAILPRKANQLPLRDILSDALAQVAIPSGICTYQVRGSQLVIIPSYQPPSRPGADPLNPPVQLANAEEDVKFISDKMLFEQIYGGVVSVSSEKKLLPEILADLRKQTGANIVLDPRCQPQAQKASLSVSLNDVRLYDVLRIIADMAELKLVYAGNVYYVTTTENAKTFQPPPRPIVYQNPFWPNQLGGGFGGTFPIQNDAIPPMAKQPPAVEQKKP